MMTLLVASLVDRSAPVMLSPDALPTVKSTGSMVQVPVRPWGAAVVMVELDAMSTVAAEVSTAPPSPPPGALASSVPLTFTAPLCMSPRRLITPLRLPMVWAWMTPVLFTTVLSSCPAAWAVRVTRPPSAWIMPPF